MITIMRELCYRTGHLFISWKIGRKTLSSVCCIVFVCMLIPLVIISLFNYPADDDFGFALPVAEAWIQTGSLTSMLQAIYNKTYAVYMEAQGYFVSTALFSINAMIVNIDFYFINNLLLLFLLCSSVAYFLKALYRTIGTCNKGFFWIMYTASMVLVLQFIPNIDDGIYWHVGGMYIVVSCALLLHWHDKRMSE